MFLTNSLLRFRCPVSSLICSVVRRRSFCSNQELTRRIELTDREREIFDLLLGASSCAPKKVVLRATGSWVRNKLLGRPISTLEITVEKMLCSEFAWHLRRYADEETPKENSVCLQNIDHSTVSLSMQLEVMGAVVLGKTVNFQSLQVEDFAVNQRKQFARLPVKRFASPAEDAMRRDFTINALFYNLHTNALEDFTKQGLSDISNGIIRAVGPPGASIGADPVRALRAFRLLTENQRFKLDGRLKAAIYLRDTRIILQERSSKHHLGIEMMGLLAAPRCHEIFSQMTDMKFVRCVFSNNREDQLWAPEDWELAVRRVEIYNLLSKDNPYERRMCVFSLLFASLPENTTEMALNCLLDHWKITHTASESQLGMMRAIAGGVDLLSESACAAVLEGDSEAVKAVGNWLLTVPEPLWKVTAVVTGVIRETQEEVQKVIVAPGQALIDCVEKSGLTRVYSMKPLMTGDDIASLLHVDDPPMLGELSTALKEFQMVHPHATLEMAQDFVVQCHADKMELLDNGDRSGSDAIPLEAPTHDDDADGPATQWAEGDESVEEAHVVAEYERSAN